MLVPIEVVDVARNFHWPPALGSPPGKGTMVPPGQSRT
jgi:hypothetical protein